MCPLEVCESELSSSCSCLIDSLPYSAGRSEEIGTRLFSVTAVELTGMFIFTLPTSEGAVNGSEFFSCALLASFCCINRRRCFLFNDEVSCSSVCDKAVASELSSDCLDVAKGERCPGGVP